MPRRKAGGIFVLIHQAASDDNVRFAYAANGPTEKAGFFLLQRSSMKFLSITGTSPRITKPSVRLVCVVNYWTKVDISEWDEIDSLILHIEMCCYYKGKMG